jgi:hypothetical protein
VRVLCAAGLAGKYAAQAAADSAAEGEDVEGGDEVWRGSRRAAAAHGTDEARPAVLGLAVQQIRVSLPSSRAHAGVGAHLAGRRHRALAARHHRGRCGGGEGGVAGGDDTRTRTWTLLTALASHGVDRWALTALTALGPQGVITTGEGYDGYRVQLLVNVNNR